jgi:hypothetical protein
VANRALAIVAIASRSGSEMAMLLIEGSLFVGPTVSRLCFGGGGRVEPAGLLRGTTMA